jgi:ATP-dependent RNA helicase RhlE
MRVPSNALLLLPLATELYAFAPASICKKCRRPSPSSSNIDWHLHATADLSCLTVPELKERLKDQGCKVSGRKSELIERLDAAYALDTAVDVSIDDTDLFKPPAPTDAEDTASLYASSSALSRLTIPQLKKLLKAQNCAAVSQHRRQHGNEKQIVASPNETADSLDIEFDSIFDSGDELNTPVADTATSGFADMNIPRPVLRRLDELGFKEPTPIQRDAIPVALNGVDVMGLAQTGTGKTFAFGIPLVSKLLDSSEHDARGKNSITPKSVSALVLAPTRELANQIAGELENLTEGSPIKTYKVYGGATISTQERRLERGVHILVATPGRLLDLMRRGAVSLKDTRFLVLDESDQMLDMGFAPDLERIASELPLQRQTMLFSATISRRMVEVTNLYLKDPVRVEVARSGMTADKITQEIHYITKMDKMSKLTSLMKKHVGERTVIFGRTKHGMEKLCQRINHAGIKATSIHGNKSQAQRDRAIQAFKSGDIKVLVATDVAARGLDIPEVKHVYNYELPDKAENYIHRIGRTARAGEDGASISFCSAEEMSDLAAIEALLGGPIPVASGTPWTVQRGERIFRRGAGGQRQKRSGGNNSQRMYR